MKILFGNTTCKLLDIKDDEINELDNVLSYKDDSAEYAYQNCKKQIARFKRLLDREENQNVRKAYSSKMRQLYFMLKSHDEKRKIYMIDQETESFPSGLLPRVLEWADSKGISCGIQDERVKPTETRKLRLYKEFPELRHYQVKAIDLALKEERGVIVSPTGSGKSLLFTKLIQELGVKTLVITPNKNITDNAYDTLSEFFGKNNVKKLTKSTKPAWINVCNIQTLVKMDPEIFEDFGACIVDEFHHSSAATYLTVNKDHLKNCYYRIGLTATNFRNSGDGLALESVLSNEIYKYTIKEAVQEGFLVKPTFKSINNKVKAPNKYQKQYKEGIVDNDDRNNRIAEICEKHVDDNVIVLVQQVEHVQNLKDLMPEATCITGKEKDADRVQILEDFRNGEIKCLIGTSVLGEGVDLPIANVLILAGGGKAKSQVIQNVGRVLRLYPGKDSAIIYDFKDKGAAYLEKHSDERAEIYKENYFLD